MSFDFEEPDAAREARTELARLARSWLLVPPTDLARLHTAVATSPDCLVLDLEDGVPYREKTSARTVAAQWLRDRVGWVRVNDASTRELALDLEILRDSPGLTGIVLAKTESPQDIDIVSAALPHVPIVAMVETASSLRQADRIAECSPVVRLAFGIRDFCSDLDIDGTPEGLAYARSTLVIASKTAEIAAPIDGPSAADDRDIVAADIDTAQKFGMTGKLSVRARHVDTINERFSPSAHSVSQAHATIAELGPCGENIETGADRPRFISATAVLSRSRYFGRLEATKSASLAQ
ncbi:aldolase/citrate lyase family protein [Rhodococcus pyridinivorans]|uniref:HpcH/HpaI aldolase/citrate lyase family protein n=1 Tax=Rhodococcus pyridinivorans TaxID=103816 RepID=UPI002227A091|nr:aldolase/citrate lyase family protein [Rhodococcus pyridinivorans]MCW3471143.1 aldolase/citrate lyase family protein [Rhodococcus pyridinivorans]